MIIVVDYLELLKEGMEMTVRLRDNYAEISIFCKGCKKYLTLKVNYSHRDSADRLPFPYVSIHGEPKHALTLYLDADMQVRGAEVLTNISMEGPDSIEVKLFPYQIGKISPIIKRLGMISQKEYEVLEKCDGKTSVLELSKDLGIKIDDLNKILDKLSENSLVDVKKVA